MLTRCPECTTRFRVHEEQLQVAEGKVRCGRCGCVFDARIYSSQVPPATEYAAADAVIVEHHPEPGADTAADAGTIPTSPIRSRPPHVRKVLGGGAVLLLLIALGLQGLWWQRYTLAAHPEGLPLVRLLCRIAPCRPQPPRALEHIEILERGLEPHPDRNDTLRFHLRIVNRAPLAQPYPLLELRLLDGLQQLAGARRFTPSQYLAAEGDGLLDLDTPIDIDLELLSPGDHVSGFQLDFF